MLSASFQYRFLQGCIGVICCICCLNCHSPTGQNPKSSEPPIPGQCCHDSLLTSYHALKDIATTPKKPQQLCDLAYTAYRAGDSTVFYMANPEAEQLAKRLGDTTTLAAVYWNYGAFFLQKEELEKAYAYYQRAQSLYHQTGNRYYEGKMYYNMAYIRSRIKDYTGSEILLIKAIRLYRPLQKHKALYKSYNLLGALYEELEEYPKALEGLQKARLHLHELPPQKQRKGLALLENNIGVVYHKWRKDSTALVHYNNGLELISRNNYPRLLARLWDNQAHARLHLRDTLGVYAQLIHSLQLKDSLRHTPGLVMGNLHLAEYFLLQQDTAQALSFAQKAYHLADPIQLRRDQLKALKFLALYGESPVHFKEYISLNNALGRKERREREKFTKIQYRTETYKKENRTLSIQIKMLLAGILGLSLVFGLLWIIVYQRHRNRQLQFESFQHKATEKIYRLTLHQQEQQDKARFLERERIAEDLHDGVLGDLFGLRFNWTMLRLDAPKPVLTKHEENLQFLQHIEKNIRNISKDLQKTQVLHHATAFEKILQKLVLKKQKLASFPIEVIGLETINWEALCPELKVNLYMIIEEALQNTIKHAKCTNVQLHFTHIGKSFRLSIKDNGQGFTGNRTGMGLKNMRSRAHRLKGHFSLRHQLKGTTLLFTFPT